MKVAKAFLLIVVMALVAVASWGADAPADAPESAQAIAARTKYEAALKPAQNAFDRAALAAKRQYSRDLGEALKTATRENAAGEISRIKALQEAIDAEIEGLSARLAAGSATTRPAAGPELVAGLLVREFPRHPSQDKGDVFVPPAQLGKPVAEYVAVFEDKGKADAGENHDAGWTFDHTRNAAAHGLLRIDVAGEYAFETARESHGGGKGITKLFINGVEVKKIERGRLAKGYVTIDSIGVMGNGRVVVRWIPPGKREPEPIPAELFFHREAADPAH